MKKKLQLLMIALMVIGVAFTSCKKDDPAEEEEKKEEPTGCTDATIPLYTFNLGTTSYQVTGSGTSITGIPGYRLVLYQSGSMVMTILLNAKPTTGSYALEPLTGTQASAGKAQISVQTYKSGSEGTLCITVNGNKATVVINNVSLPSQVMGSPTTISAHLDVTLAD